VTCLQSRRQAVARGHSQLQRHRQRSSPAEPYVPAARADRQCNDCCCSTSVSAQFSLTERANATLWLESRTTICVSPTAFRPRTHHANDSSTGMKTLGCSPRATAQHPPDNIICGRCPDARFPASWALCLSRKGHSGDEQLSISVEAHHAVTPRDLPAYIKGTPDRLPVAALRPEIAACAYC
jgi:hypothetical protein